MATYVMGDIHGCYDEFTAMLAKLSLSGNDRLILVGDYIDRGKKSFEMLSYIEHCPKNIWLVRGNHEEEFAAYVDFMRTIDAEAELRTNPDSNDDLAALYDTVRYLFRVKGIASESAFDVYGTLGKLIREHGITLQDCIRWRNCIQQMKFYYRVRIKDRTCIAVHAGYLEQPEHPSKEEVEQFYLYSREEAFKKGGMKHGMVIAGHTPTIIKGYQTYTDGDVFRYYDEEKDCVFYDIDCGCVFRTRHENAKLACLRLEDEKVFYV